MIDDALRGKMMRILGQLDAIAFPLVTCKDNGFNQAYYDLIDSIREQYLGVLKELWGYDEK